MIIIMNNEHDHEDVLKLIMMMMFTNSKSKSKPYTYSLHLLLLVVLQNEKLKSQVTSFLFLCKSHWFTNQIWSNSHLLPM